MKTPIIFLVDDDPQVLKAVRRDVRRRYKAQYRIMSTESAQEALDSLAELKKQSQVVAMFLSDQRMPEMLGVDFLEKAKEFFPDAKRALLTAYSDIEAAIRAINEVSLDYYLTKPWNPPEEKLYPVLDDLLEEWQGSYIPEFAGIKIVGSQWSKHSHAIKDFLSGNLVPYQWFDAQDESKSQELITAHNLTTDQMPAVIFEDGSILTQPQPRDIATKLGRKAETQEQMYDVAIIGAGPAGLGAAVYGASEGLKTLLIERRAPGGQAGTSSRIENYLGFPSGLSGSDLARRAITQATRFGTEFLSPAEVSEITIQDNYKILRLADGQQINAKSLVITTGVDYRKLEGPGMEKFSGAGVYYGAATTEAYACSNQDVYIVGGGNSAGQGAMYLSRFARKVYIVIRRDSLVSTMSDYLIKQIEGTDNIELIIHTNVAEALGQDRLECLVLEHKDSKERRTVSASALFIFIGARPYTEWIGLDLIRNDRGYLITGPELRPLEPFQKNWKVGREPYLLETSVPGIFAAGDVRAGAMNRVASAVGEGAMTISMV
ncbi:MAG: FAD-dependent oxidoreductase, partial [Bacteroidota bacterium]